MFYCSNPLAAALTRRRTQFFYLFLGISHLPQFFEFVKYVSNGVPWEQQFFMSSQHFRFELLESRDSSCQGNWSRLSSSTFGLTRNGKKIDTAPNFWNSTGSVVLFSFQAPVEWSGWYFNVGVPSPSPCDPMRFSFHTLTSIPGPFTNASATTPWKQVGSSSSVQVAATTVFLNGRYEQGLGGDGNEVGGGGGRTHHFHVQGPKFWGFLVARLVGGAVLLGMAYFGATRRARVGELLPHAFSALFISCQAIFDP
jgi:hypothetical protein